MRQWNRACNEYRRTRLSLQLNGLNVGESIRVPISEYKAKAVNEESRRIRSDTGKEFTTRRHPIKPITIAWRLK